MWYLSLRGSTNNNRRRRTSATIRHKFITAIVREKKHSKKCHVLTLGKFITLPTLRSTPFHQQELEHVFEQKDLGVILHAELKFDEHLPAKVKKANAIAGLIRRTFLYLDGTLLKKLFTTFVRPHLEYGQVIWT